MKQYQKNSLKIVFWLALAGLFIMSSIPELPVQTSGGDTDTGFRFDYLFHFLAYASLGILYVLSYPPKFRGFLLIVFYAALEELHQHWIPGRTVNPMDFGCDVAGLGTVVLIWLFWKLVHRDQSKV